MAYKRSKTHTVHGYASFDGKPEPRGEHMRELDEPVEGIVPRSLLEPDEVYVPWVEVGNLAQEVGLKLNAWIDTHGPIDTIVAVKHGATGMAMLLERTVPHGMLRYAKTRRLESGLTVVENPLPVIDYFPEDEYLRGKNVAVFDEVYETGKSTHVVEQRAWESKPLSVILVALHWKEECNLYPDRTPDIFGAKIDRRFRCYAWELWERVMKARIARMKGAEVAA